MEVSKRWVSLKKYGKSWEVSSIILCNISCVGAIGAGNTFQVSQSLAVAQEQIAFYFQTYPYPNLGPEF